MSGPCRFNEAVFTGVEVIDNDKADFECSAELWIRGKSKAWVLKKAKYSGASTPLLTEISPRFGTVVGGTDVVFTGTGFTDTVKDISIVIDGIVCAVSKASKTSITCKTGKRPGLPATSLVINIAGKGLVSNNGNTFLYVNMWSADTTWGGEFSPTEMESVFVPKGLNLYVDVDSTPKMNAILVEGSLIFAPDKKTTHVRTFDAMYIFIKGGYMEVGTEKHPYTSKMTITMHGTQKDPYIPIYGNKCIGLRFGTLDMHGVKRDVYWTVLDKTALKGATKITLAKAVDWKVGEQIAIAATGYSGREGEKRFIKKIVRSNINKPEITLDKPLEY